MLGRGDTFIIRKITKNRISVSDLLHDKRKTMFLRNRKFTQKVNTRCTLDKKTELKFVYEYDLAKSNFLMV